VVLKKDVEVGLGEIGVFLNKTSGESLVKRLKKKNGIFVLESDNHIFRDIEVKSDEICCCGKVINVVKKDLKKRVNPLQDLLDDIPADKLALAEKLLKTLIPDEDKK
ncbi:MAG: LexA family protein, partial [Cetobacterium sp.]